MDPEVCFEVSSLEKYAITLGVRTLELRLYLFLLTFKCHL